MRWIDQNGNAGHFARTTDDDRDGIVVTASAPLADTDRPVVECQQYWPADRARRVARGLIEAAGAARTAEPTFDRVYRTPDSPAPRIRVIGHQRRVTLILIDHQWTTHELDPEVAIALGREILAMVPYRPDAARETDDVSRETTDEPDMSWTDTEGGTGEITVTPDGTVIKTRDRWGLAMEQHWSLPQSAVIACALIESADVRDDGPLPHPYIWSQNNQGLSIVATRDNVALGMTSPPHANFQTLPLATAATLGQRLRDAVDTDLAIAVSRETTVTDLVAEALTNAEEALYREAVGSRFVAKNSVGIALRLVEQVQRDDAHRLPPLTHVWFGQALEMMAADKPLRAPEVLHSIYSGIRSLRNTDWEDADNA